MKPLSTKSNGKEIIYGYSSSKPDTIIGHAFSEGNKYVLKYLNNPKFKKYFDNIESIHTWAKENFTSR